MAHKYKFRLRIENDGKHEWHFPEVLIVQEKSEQKWKNLIRLAISKSNSVVVSEGSSQGYKFKNQALEIIREFKEQKIAQGEHHAFTRYEEIQ